MRGGEGFRLVYICKMRRREKGEGSRHEFAGEGGGKAGKHELDVHDGKSFSWVFMWWEWLW